MLRILKLLLISLVLSRFAIAASASTKNKNSANRSAVTSGTDQFGAYANSLAPTTTSTSASSTRTSATSSNGTTAADSAAIAGNLNADSTPLAGDVNAATSTSGTTTSGTAASGTTSATTSTAGRTPTAREISAVTGMPIAEATCLSSDRFIGKEKECIEAARQLAPQLEVIAAIDERNQVATSGTSTATSPTSTQTPAADAANRAVNDPQLAADLALLQKIVGALGSMPDPASGQQAQQGGVDAATLQQLQGLLTQ